MLAHGISVFFNITHGENVENKLNAPKETELYFTLIKLVKKLVTPTAKYIRDQNSACFSISSLSRKEKT